MFEEIEEIEEIIISRNLNKFLGQKENNIFEAKGMTAYDITVPSGRFEISKDISSMANSDGGYMVFGLKHEPAVDERTDVVTELELFSEAECHISSYLGIAKDGIYPKIDGIRGEWVEDINQTGLGVGYIFIPPQIEQKKYFLITKLIEEGEEQKGIIVGIIKRVKADSVPFSVQELYGMMQNGKGEIAKRLYSIESKIDHLSKFSQKKEDSSKKLSGKIKEILK